MRCGDVMDIRIIEPDEKILVSIPGDVCLSVNEVKRIRDDIKRFREVDNLLIISGADIYVVKDGDRVLLKDELENVDISLVDD